MIPAACGCRDHLLVAGGAAHPGPLPDRDGEGLARLRRGRARRGCGGEGVDDDREQQHAAGDHEAPGETRLSSVRPFEIDWMTRMPSSAEYAEPRPPKRLVPPMTAAAIALRLTSPPPLALVGRRRAAGGEEATERGERRAEHEHGDVDPARR